ncbi:hypothetical protein Tsubulata_037584, partial [Turnera subulata]
MAVHEDDDHDGGRKRSSKRRRRLTTTAWEDTDNTCPLTSLEASYKRITLALTKPSYLLGHPAVSTLRQESRARLLNLLRRLESQHDWTEAAGALAVMLKGTRKDSSPDVNRFKYTDSFLVHLVAILFQLLHGNVEAERHNVRRNDKQLPAERNADFCGEGGPVK